MQEEDHPHRLVSQHVLARAYLADGQTKKAIEILERVVAVETKMLAKDDPGQQLLRDLLQRCYEWLEGASS
jgi:predicted Zn-dependent protease